MSTGLAVAAIAAVVLLSSGGKKKTPGSSVPRPWEEPDDIKPPVGGGASIQREDMLRRVAAALATGNPAAMRAEAAKLRAGGWPDQASDLEKAAQVAEALGVPSSPVVVAPSPGNTSPPVVVNPSQPPPVVAPANPVGPIPNHIKSRVVTALSSGNPATMRAEAKKLRAEGYPDQAADLERAANVADALLGTSPPAPSTPGVVVAPPPGNTSPPVVVAPPPAVLPAGPRVLKLGVQGPDVLGWQQTLLLDGLSVSQDGIFGPATEAATKEWQTDRGLKADGIVGDATRAAVGKPPKLGYRLLRQGSTGGAVKVWQGQLMLDGYPALKQDGNFGPSTDAATRGWQTARRISADGVVGPSTISAIGSPAAPVAAPVASVRNLSQGMTGEDVRAWQLVLAADKLLVSAGIDGNFGAQTRMATITWQQKRGLTADGIVGPSTRAAAAAPAVGAAPPLVVDPDKWRTMRRGTAGTDVKEWQLVLGRDGYPVAADGQFGAETEAATKAWQKARGLVADGVVGANTRNAIADTAFGSNMRVSGDLMMPYLPLRSSSPLPGILAMQVPTEVVPPDRSLAARTAAHLFNVRPGQEDRELVEAFQLGNGINASGSYTPATALGLVPYGIVPPKPFYWPRKGLLKAKASYRLTLLEQAKRDPQREDEWRAAANV